MDINKQINSYIQSQSEIKRKVLLYLHVSITSINRDCKLWFLDGKNEEGKVVANPNIGYGQYTIQYADGTTKEFYRVGLSANTTGVSVYIMGLPDNKFLIDNYAERIGKAKITGYCIKFKSLADISLTVLEEAIQHAFKISECVGK
jgi:hypothetical protein